MTDQIHADPGDVFDIVITPKGVKAKNKGWANAFALILRSVNKTYHLVRLELQQTSFGLYFGNFWLLLEPALQAAAYYFLLKVVFNFNGADATFAFFLIGITFWRSHATLVTSAPYFLIGKGHQYVEQGFGLPTAYMETVANELLLLFVRLVVLGLFLIVAGYTPQLAWLLIVPVVAIQFTFSMACHVWLSMLGVVFKDSGRFVGHVVWLWWYLSPGLYSIRRIPEWGLFVYNLNPFAHLIPSYHASLLNGGFDVGSSLLPLLYILVASLAVLWAGLARLKTFSYSMTQYV